MKLNEREVERCGECNNVKRVVAYERYGCDWCGVEIQRTVEAGKRQYLQATVFRHQGGDAMHLEFCSWACCLAKVRSVPCDYFIDLPFLYYDDAPKGQRAKDFFKAITFTAPRKTKVAR